MESVTSMDLWRGFPLFGFKAVCDVLNAKARNPSYSELCSISGTHNSFKELTTSVELCNVL